MSAISAPHRLASTHDVSSFSSGVAALDDWLGRRALQHDAAPNSRCFVVTVNGRVVGYYALCTGAVVQRTAAAARKKASEPVPVMILSRLAVDRDFQGRHLGAGLLKDALLRTLAAADAVGIRAMLVHVVSDEARRFFLHHGFAVGPVGPATMLTTLAVVTRNLGT